MGCCAPPAGPGLTGPVGQPPVDDEHAAGVVDEYVVWFDVRVHVAALKGVHQRARQLKHDAQLLRHLHTAAGAAV